MLKTHSSPQPKKTFKKELILILYLNVDPVVFRTSSSSILTIRSLYYLKKQVQIKHHTFGILKYFHTLKSQDFIFKWWFRVYIYWWGIMSWTEGCKRKDKGMSGNQELFPLLSLVNRLNPLESCRRWKIFLRASHSDSGLN